MRLICRFDSLSIVLAPAAGVAQGYVRCPLPPIAPGFVAVSLSTNGVDFSHALPFRMVESDVVSVQAGRTFADIHGNQFHPHLSICQPTGYPQRTALFESTRLIRCAVDDVLLTEVAELTLASRCQSSPELNISFAQQRPLHIESVSPSAGPEDGGTVVVIQTSRRYLRSVTRLAHCRFGDTLVPAIAASQHEIMCASPKLERQGCNSHPSRPRANQSFCRFLDQEEDVSVQLTIMIEGELVTPSSTTHFSYHPVAVVLR